MMRLVVNLILTLCLAWPAGVAVAQSYTDRWRAVADSVTRTPPEEYPFNWGEGVLLIGMMKIHERTQDDRYADYVERWARLHPPPDVNELLEAGLKTRDGGRTRPGYCGHWSPGTALLYLYQARRKPEHLRLAEQVLEFIRTSAERSPEGGLGHWQGSHQLWVDTLYMACPLLAGFGEFQNKSEYIDDAANQLIVHARHLQDEESGLFYHMWDWQEGTKSPGFWGRGNGWVIMSLAETLEPMDRTHPSYTALKAITEKLAKGLEATQNSEGLWHTILDDPSSYPEVSASLMACYGVLKLVRLKVLSPSYAYVEVARRAWSVVNEGYVENGIVTGVSAGTEPRGGDHYRKRPQGSETWGTGAYLMAGSEMDRLR